MANERDVGLNETQIRQAFAATEGANVRSVAWVLGVSGDSLLREMVRLGLRLTDLVRP